MEAVLIYKSISEERMYIENEYHLLNFLKSEINLSKKLHYSKEKGI